MADTEKPTWTERLDEWGRRHRGWVLLLALLLALVATPFMIKAGHEAAVLYQDF